MSLFATSSGRMVGVLIWHRGLRADGGSVPVKTLIFLLTSGLVVLWAAVPEVERITATSDPTTITVEQYVQLGPSWRTNTVLRLLSARLRDGRPLPEYCTVAHVQARIPQYPQSTVLVDIVEKERQ